jgi:hypothetical protein
MRITAIVVAGLLAGTLATASPAQAEMMAQPAHSHFYPLQPSPGLQSDPESEVQELLRQISELDDSWDSLSPAQRNQRIAGLQQQVTTVQRDVQNLPPDQRPEVQGMLGVAVIRLADILRKEQTPPTSPCIFPLCLPGL